MLLVPKILTNSDFGPCDIWLSTFNLQLIERYTFDPSTCESTNLISYVLLNYLRATQFCN